MTIIIYMLIIIMMALMMRSCKLMNQEGGHPPLCRLQINLRSAAARPSDHLHYAMMVDGHDDGDDDGAGGGVGGGDIGDDDVCTFEN